MFQHHFSTSLFNQVCRASRQWPTMLSGAAALARTGRMRDRPPNRLLLASRLGGGTPLVVRTSRLEGGGPPLSSSPDVPTGGVPPSAVVVLARTRRMRRQTSVPFAGRRNKTLAPRLPGAEPLLVKTRRWRTPCAPVPLTSAELGTGGLNVDPCYSDYKAAC